MSYLLAPPPQQLLIGDEAIATAGLAGNITIAPAANAVILYAFTLSVPHSVTKLAWRCGTTAASTTQAGIYTFAGAIVANSDTGAVNNSASAVVSSTYGTAISLGAGSYYLAIASTSGTDTYLGTSTNFGTDAPLSTWRKATNVLAAGALPLTLGAILNTTSAVGIFGYVSGGLA